MSSFQIDRAYALVIGVGGNDIKVTVNDAEDIGAVLKNNQLAGYPSENVSVLTAKNSSREKVIDTLDWLAQKTNTEPNTTLLIYYSGHGVRLRSGSDKEESYLATHGFKLDDPENTMISASVFSKKIASLKSPRVLVLLDCCHAAGMKIKGDSVQLKSATPFSPATGAEFIKQLQSGSGRVFISSCAENEKSVILPGANNSIFTEVALNALKGMASGEDPFVKVIDLMYLLLREVPQRVKKYDHPQNPVINEVKNLNSSYIICLNSQQGKENKNTGFKRKSIGEPSDSEKMQYLKDYPYHIKTNIFSPTNSGSGTQINISQFININNHEAEKIKELASEKLSEIEQKLAEGKAQEAIEKMLMLSSVQYPSLKSKVIQLAASYNQWLDDKTSNVISYTEGNIELAKINRHALHLISKMKQE